MYESPSIRVEETVYPVNVSTPTFMRAPGECPGTYALESAMDELAYALKMDPVALRLANHADNHPTKNIPFSAKHLKEAYQLGAEKFGWSKRNPKPKSMSNGRNLIGWGMASATYPAHRSPASARATMKSDGTVLISSGSHEMGMGTATVMAQLAAETLGLTGFVGDLGSAYSTELTETSTDWWTTCRETPQTPDSTRYTTTVQSGFFCSCR